MLASSSKHALNASLRVPVNLQIVRAGRGSSTPWTVGGIASKRSATMQARPQGGKREDGARHLRGRPWNFEQDNVKFKRGSRTTEYNLKIQSISSAKRFTSVLEEVVRMKKNGVQPDLLTYNIIMHALAQEQMHQEAWATLKDMKAVGIEPDITSFNHLIFAVRYCNTDQLYNVLEEMNNHGIKPNSKTYDMIISYYLEGGNLEVALCRMAEMNDLGFAPSLQVAQLLIDAAAERGYARLALDLAEAYEQTTIRRLDNETWVKLLVACADSLYATGVQLCWKKVVDELRILPDEGLCQSVLHTAARHGLPSLAADAIRSLETIGVKFREQHFAPLFDSFVRNSQLKEAFRTLDLMRSSNITPKLDTAQTLLQVIQRDPDTIDGAYALLEELHKEGQNVDVVAANVIIRASSFLHDLQRAVGIYKAMPSLGIRPDVETFNILLSVCIEARHLDLGERLFGEMKMTGLKPTEVSYAKFISLILTQADYENAFFYLEEMKAAGHTPSYSVYESIIKKCVSVGDTRFSLAVEELEQIGYRVSSGLQSFIDSGGKEWRDNRPDDDKLPFETRKRLRATSARHAEASVSACNLLAF